VSTWHNRAAHFNSQSSRKLPGHERGIFSDINYAALYEHHMSQENDITVSVYKRTSKIDFGVLKFDSNNVATEFMEKPVFHFDVSMGIYCLNRSVIDQLDKGKPYGFDNLMVDGIKNRQKIGVKPFGGVWLDLGRPEDFDRANEQYEQLKPSLGLLE